MDADHSGAIVAALRDRAERGPHRGAEAVVAAAWQDRDDTTGAEPADRRRRHRRAALVAAAAILIVTVVVARVRLGPDPVTIGPGHTLTTSAPAQRIASVEAPGTRFNPNSRTVWTGSEVIVVGGLMHEPAPGKREIAESPALDPLTGQLRLIPAPPVPLRDWQMSTVWTGTALLLVAHEAGGHPSPRSRGFAYEEGRGWSEIAAPPAVLGMVWADDRVIGWTGWEIVTYDPGTDGWTTLASLWGAELDRLGPAVWTGSELVFLGDKTTVFHEGPAAELRTVATSPFAAEYATWTGSSIVIYRNDVDGGSGRVALFDPVTGRWTEGRRTARGQIADYNTATWVAGRLVLPEVRQWETAPFGTVGPNGQLSLSPTEAQPTLGLSYRPDTDTWSPIPALPTALGASPAADRLVVWTNETVEPGPTTLAASIWTPG
jgi:hypothetical protein